MSRPRVAYFYDSAFAVAGRVKRAPVDMWGGAGEIGNYHYGQGHPMKARAASRSRAACTHGSAARARAPQPHRVRMAHHLIVNYGLYKQMDVFVSARGAAWGGGGGSCCCEGPAMTRACFAPDARSGPRWLTRRS